MVGRAGKHDMPPDTDHQQSAISFQRLCEIVAKLRGPGGCPWDAEQTNESLLPALIEEAYEVAGGGRAADEGRLLHGLGDILLFLLIHTENAAGGAAVPT